MHQRDMERFAFLFLCGKRDRAILLGKEKMTFSEHLHDKWLQEFCTQVADQEMRKQLEQIIKQQYQEKGMVDPTETDIV